MAKTILQEPAPGKSERGRPRRSWMDDIKEWTGLGGRGLQSRAHNREEWRKLVHVTPSVPQRPPIVRGPLLCNQGAIKKLYIYTILLHILIIRLFLVFRIAGSTKIHL